MYGVFEYVVMSCFVGSWLASRSHLSRLFLEERTRLPLLSWFLSTRLMVKGTSTRDLTLQYKYLYLILIWSMLERCAPNTHEYLVQPGQVLVLGLPGSRYRSTNAPFTRLDRCVMLSCCSCMFSICPCSMFLTPVSSALFLGTSTGTRMTDNADHGSGAVHVGVRKLPFHLPAVLKDRAFSRRGSFTCRLVNLGMTYQLKGSS